MASSRLWTTSGALVSSRFVVTVPAGVLLHGIPAEIDPAVVLEITQKAAVITQHIAAQFGWTTKENVP
jgi:hypothetical protein